MSGFLINPHIFGTVGTPPDDIANLDIWWDPSDSGNRTLSGSTITTLTNKGSGGTATVLQHAVNSSGTTSPDISTVDGIDWANFVAATKHALRLPGVNTVYPRGSASFTMAVVFRSTQNTTFMTPFGQGRTGSTAGWKLQVNSTSTTGTMSNFMVDTSLTVAQTGSAVDASAVDGSTRVMIMMRDNNAGTFGELTTYLDGNLEDTHALPSGYGTIDETYSSSWQDLIIGARPAGGASVYQNWTDALIGDMLIYGQALSSEEISGLTQFLRKKWKA
jgi:hypothetical protein